ncbi:MAG: hypothetical protein IKN59_06485 [Paludibacteraceae bacterium]|nr:hypothetical protein [Paludibacteraceae bacterium]
MKRNRYIGFVMAVLLIIGGAVESVWATKVTYHILTLPINSSRYDYQMVSEVTGYRLEALRVVVDQSSVELPNQFKSPLATNYRYYPTSAIVTGNSSRALQLFANNTKTKGYIYKVKHVDTDDSEVAPVTEGTAIEGDNAEYYVIYDYNEANTIAQLDGSVQYNIGIKNKGFLSYNRGRNNRPAVMPKGKVEAEMLTSEDFVKIENPGSGIGEYWKDAANNKNKQSEVESQFHFIFRFEGKDPYNIIIRTAYNKELSYIEKNDDTGEFVYKWYKGGSLYGVTTNNLYIASDEHIKYNYAYNSTIANPTVLTYDNRPGQFHGQTKNAIWGSFALLNNTSQDGYVFMGTRTVDDNGAMPTPGSDGKYNYLKFDYNNLTINKLTPKEATNNYSTEGIYPIKTIRFHVKTPFGHTLTASFNQSDYVLQSAYIDAQDIPESLHRKYCVFTGFYSDADHTHAIVKYSERTTDDIYVDYEVSSAIPFQAIAPDASYTTATWYELTDEGSVQESGRKIKNNSGTYKNNGANGEYVKESEFAFVGDPYELKVLYRKGSESARANTYVTLSTYDAWDIPNDDIAGSFLLRKYNDAGYWSWNAGQLSADVAYHADPTINVDKDAKTITITVSGLNGGKYFGITTGGTGASQIESITPAVGSVYDETANAVTVTVKLKENTTGSAKEITVTIQEYDNDGGSTPSEDPANPSVITITQSTTSTFEGNIVTYSTTERTRVKVLDLPKCDFTYKIVDKSGRIAVQATASQTIFSPLSLASIPSIIFSPFLADETVTFYDSYTDRNGDSNTSRLDFHNPSEQTPITETPEANHDIFVTYTTGSLSAKPIKLSEDQEFYVKLNDHYLYCEKVGENVVVKTSSERVANDAYKWKLRNYDPYAMLVDNIAARTALSVSGAESVTVYANNGTPSTESRDRGAWVDVASIINEGALSFTTTRADAQRFIAKRSNQGGIYEVMVATGTTVDASTTYYNIGCPGVNTVKIYSNDVANGGYVHGSDVLRFVLESETEYTYHLIDKSDTILLEVGSKSPDLMFPAEYQSPLVGTYHYYDIDQFTVTNGVYTLIEGADTLTNISDLDATVSAPESSTAKAYNDADDMHKHSDATTTEEITAKAKKLETTGAHYYVIGSDYYVVNVSKAYYRKVYVTYDKNDLVTFNSNTSPYLLKFLNPLVSGYRLENGNDGLTSEEIQAVYPYCNGDGNLNVYGTEMNREQMEGGSSTRPRWVWFFESDNNDPYHVKIHSKSTISFKSINHPTYLQTYAVHFNQDANAQKQHIVTGGVLPGISSIPPSEYMVLGTEGNYRLMTTDRVPADLNGDGDTSDDGENMRQVVNAFEQYWKTYNMIKLDVLDIDKSDNAYDTDESTWVVPEAQRATLKDKLASYKHTATDDGDLVTKINALTATGVYFFKVGDSYKKVTVTTLATAAPAANAVYTAEDCNASDWEGLNYVDGWFWHSYDAFANATRWNGFNDKASGEEKKVVEKLEHWFQTIDMGNGAFDIVSADIPPVLVLLDRHGWEIMRKPLPKASTYPYGEELDALRIYDSPMVKEYKFYSNATKASGCHKYTLRLNDKGEERDQIKVDGEQFTSTSLAALPPRAASGVISSGAFNDQYVTYTVKDEYEESYRYHLNEETYAETGSKASKYVVLCNGRYARDKRGDFSKYHDSYFSKPIYEGSTPTGGNIYDMILSPTHTPVGDVYVDEDNNGFVDDVCLWYVTPNLNIDEEMGIKWGTATTGAEPLTQDATKLAYKDKTGFDPYNIQLKNSDNSLFFTTHMTSSKLVNGSMVGDYSGTDGSFYVTPEVEFTAYEPTVDKGSEGYDHTNLQISNQTFMAVQDAKGNMQLMPRFDHTKRINFAKYDPYIMTVATPVDHDKVATIADNESMGVQTMFFVRPQANIYHIIDNDGYEALRYRAGGEWYPILPDSVKSPLAKDFRFYLTASYDGGTGKYTINENSEIKESIIGALADEQLYTSNIDIYVRYSYDEDNDEEWVLKGRWFTAQLANKDMQSSDETRIVTTAGDTQGTGVSLYTGAKPGTINEDDQVWQWKFLASPMDPSSPFYEAPDPYSVKIYNRYANYSNNPSVAPNPMSIPIKVPNANNGANRFALLSHYNGGYVFAVAKTYGANPQYLYINGADMTAPSTTPATTQTEGNAIRKDANNDSDYATKILALSDGVYYFRIHGEAGGSIPLYRRVYRFKKVTVTGASRTDEDCTRTDWENARTEGIKVVLNNDVGHTYQYNVITNGGSDYVANNPGVLAISANQTKEEAATYEFEPHLPEVAQTTLLNMEDYLYFGSATSSDGKYTVNTNTKLISLEGLYDDMVYVRYNKYDVNTTPYKAPNIRNALNTGDVARADTSKDASINIKGELPYNIIWYNDNMMQSTDGSTISDGGSKDLGSGNIVWQFWGNDPYALEIKHKESGKYAVGTADLAATATKTFMLLKKEDYDYGILQETGGTAKLTGYGNELTADVSTDPTKFIIFGLSVHDLIYHLVIANTGSTVTIPYSEKDKEGNWVTGFSPSDNKTLSITGTTQRDLTNNNYQLGEALSWANTSHTYCHDAGKVTVGDSLVVPSVFMRPNCVYFYYVDDIYNDAARTNVATELNNKYKGLELTRLPKDDELVGKSVVVNVAYAFHTGLETNAGEGFVTNVADNYWYTFQTTEPTPYLAEYTKAWGLQAMEGRETRYTNDYLWSPLGDVYGFKMYNRYMYKNIGDTTNVMTKANINEAGLLEMSTPTDNAIFELLDVPNTPGAFRVHPVANYTGTQFYIYRDAADGNKVKLSTNYTGWTFGLGTDLLEPYIDRKGYVGGLTTDAYTTNKTVLDKVKNGTADQADIRAVQSIVYNDANIVQYSSGYYRLHSMPGIPGMATVRYASGYLHDTEKTAGYGSAGIPMHFYSRKGVATTFAGTDGLASGFTVSNATRGEIPIDSTEVDPSTIFHFAGAAAVSGYPSSTISTQGLYVVANANGDANNGTTDSKLQRAAMKYIEDPDDVETQAITFSVMDIGGAVLLIHDGADAEVRRYFNYDQEANIYDLKFFHNANTEEARWCMQPVQKTAAAGDGEMPLLVTTHNGGDGYYYTTFYAPFDVLLPADADGKTYYAYYCDKWNDNNLHPKKVPAVTGTSSYAAGKFVPAGTPVIIRVNDESGHVTLTLPGTYPSASPVAGNIFLGQYLEQLLTADAAHDVYTLGLPFTSEVTGFNRTTGEVTAPLPEQATSGLGFYINATPNKESAQLQSLWQRNNRYVLHNKIYFRATGGAGAPDHTRGTEFVPVLFDDDDEQPTQPDDNQQPTVGDGNVYDLLGRKVATEAEVRDGTWHLRLTPGIYIVGGKKVCVGIY